MCDTLIREYTEEHRERGERMIMAMMLATSGMSFTREEIRRSITRVDAEGLQHRKYLFDKKLIRYQNQMYSKAFPFSYIN